MAITAGEATEDSPGEKENHVLNIHNLLKELDNESKLLDVQFENNFDFNQKEYAYFIESGSVLATRENGSKTGLLPTHTLEAHDPIGFAEAIAARPTGFRFKQKTDVILRQFNSSDLRKAVAGANVFSQTIIKYSIGRILGQSRRSATIAFEDEFINKNYKLLTRRVAEQGEAVITVGSASTKMFFIEAGAVRIVSQGKKLLANLGDGECFGESALFDAKPRGAGVIASKKTTLIVIDREQVQIEINKESSMVRLIALLLIKRLEVMNVLRLREQTELA